MQYTQIRTWYAQIFFWNTHLVQEKKIVSTGYKKTWGGGYAFEESAFLPTLPFFISQGLERHPPPPPIAISSPACRRADLHLPNHVAEAQTSRSNSEPYPLPVDGERELAEGRGCPAVQQALVQGTVSVLLYPVHKDLALQPGTQCAEHGALGAGIQHFVQVHGIVLDVVGGEEAQGPHAERHHRRDLGIMR